VYYDSTRQNCTLAVADCDRPSSSNTDDDGDSIDGTMLALIIVAALFAMVTLAYAVWTRTQLAESGRPRSLSKEVTLTTTVDRSPQPSVAEQAVDRDNM
jgi:hypothetical protein